MTRLALPEGTVCIWCSHDFSEEWATEWVLDMNGGDYYHPVCKVYGDFQMQWLAAQEERERARWIAAQVAYRGPGAPHD